MIVSANMVSPSQLRDAMVQAVGRSTATADEWCYIMNNNIQGLNGGCPQLADQVLFCCGMSSDQSNRSSLPQIEAEQFLSCLQQWQSAQNAAGTGPGGTVAPAPGGGGTPAVPPAPATPGAPGQGVLGITNCSICKQLSKNPLMLVLLGVAVYYLFFE